MTALEAIRRAREISACNRLPAREDRQSCECGTYTTEWGFYEGPHATAPSALLDGLSIADVTAAEEALERELAK